MASSENCLEPFRPQLAALSDEALAAIATKGLVRRAQKDLHSDPPKILEVTEVLKLRVAEFTVTLPVTGAIQATCTCPAVDICRHILTACLWLREQLADGATPAAVETPIALLDYTLQQLTQWASKPTIRAAFDWLSRGMTCDIQAGSPILICFSDANITCRYFPATGLEGMVCSCKVRRVCHHRVAAILAYQQAHGVILEPEPSVSKSKPETPRSKPEVIAAAQRLLAEMVAIGLLHISDTSRQRFTTLAVSALGVNLPRLSLALRSISDEITLCLQRNARADESRLLFQMAQTYALCEALAQMPTPGQVRLIGQNRSHYDDVGAVELIGVGAYHWQSKSGYAGLTVLFWEPATQQWCSWSEARPLFHGMGFDPTLRYRQAGPWEGVESPAQASQSRLRLMAARRNFQRRLSASTHSKALVIAPTRVGDLQLDNCRFDNWSALRIYTASTMAIGLAEYDLLRQIVVVNPTRWGWRSFDSIRQTLTWLLLDDQDQVLPLQVQFRPVDTHRLQVLETLDPEKAGVWGIVSQIFPSETGLALYPISLLCKSEQGQSAVINLSFASTSAPPSTATATPEPSASEMPSDWDELQTSSSNFLEQQVEQLIDALERSAEQGIHKLNQTMRQDLMAEAKRFDTLGLAVLATLTETLAYSSNEATPHLLKARYLCHLCQQALVKDRLR